MITYLPYPDFDKTARCLSLKRLNRQRHHVIELLYAFNDVPHPRYGRQGYYGSPAKRLWQNYPGSLIRYGFALCHEFQRRYGKSDPLIQRLRKFAEQRFGPDFEEEYGYYIDPKWIGCVTMHESHRNILAHQDPEYYRQFGFQEKQDKVFYWPIQEWQTDEQNYVNYQQNNNRRVRNANRRH